MRAGPVMGPHRRMDSNIAERSGAHAEGLELDVGVKVSRLATVASLREQAIFPPSDGTLLMSRRVDVTVD